MTDPWTFGWNQVLTVIGFLITISIAVSGFRTFARWKREKIEERRIDIAIEALSLAYETTSVFDHIRSPMAYSHEWADMPEQPGEDEARRNNRGAFYATRKRILDHRDFFERVARLQPKFMAVFGSPTSDVFLQLHKARREIEVASEMLARRVDEERFGVPNDHATRNLYEQLRADVWAGYAEPMRTAEGDRVGRKLAEFTNGIETLCRPVIDKSYGAKRGNSRRWITELRARVRSWWRRPRYVEDLDLESAAQRGWLRRQIRRLTAWKQRRRPWKKALGQQLGHDPPK